MPIARVELDRFDDAILRVLAVEGRISATELARLVRKRNVSSRELKRLVAAARDVFRALAIVYRDAGQVQLDTEIQQRLEIENWAASLGDFTFVAPDQQNISDWLNAVDSWLNATLGWLGALRQAALEQLLVSEARVAGWAKAGATATPAAARSQVPQSYPTLTPGEERALQKRLDLWDRFQTADGFVAGAIRFAVAAGIIGGALYLTVAPHILL